MLSIIFSTIAFFVVNYYIMHWADHNDFHRGITRSISIFAFALAISYAVAWLAGKGAALAGSTNPLLTQDLSFPRNFVFQEVAV